MVQKRDINILHAEPDHPFVIILLATGKAMSLHITGMFNSCEDCALGKANKREVSKQAIQALG